MAGWESVTGWDVGVGSAPGGAERCRRSVSGSG